MTTDERILGKLKVTVAVDFVATLLLVLRLNAAPLESSNSEKITYGRFKVWNIKKIIKTTMLFNCCLFHDSKSWRSFSIALQLYSNVSL